MTRSKDGYSGTGCPVCGKVRYSSRARAKQAIRQIRSRVGGHMNAYRCGDFWHVGHTPTALIRGDITRDDLITPGHHEPNEADR
jgi:hypothetical protein